MPMRFEVKKKGIVIGFVNRNSRTDWSAFAVNSELGHSMIDSRAEAEKDVSDIFHENLSYSVYRLGNVISSIERFGELLDADDKKKVAGIIKRLQKAISA